MSVVWKANSKSVSASKREKVRTAESNREQVLASASATSKRSTGKAKQVPDQTANRIGTQDEFPERRCGLIPKHVKKSIDEIKRLRSKTNWVELFERRVRDGLSTLQSLRSSCDEEDAHLFKKGAYAPASLLPHIKNLLSREFDSGELPFRKSPAFFRKLASEIGFKFLNFDTHASPWRNGFKMDGILETNGLFEGARPLSETEERLLEEFKKFGDTGLLDKLVSKVPPLPEDPEVSQAGFDMWKPKLCDGIRLRAVDKSVVDREIVSYNFYLPQKWDPVSRSFKKIRNIINSAPRNSLCTPLAEHITLPSHKSLVQIASYCISNHYDGPLISAKNAINESIAREKSLEQTARAAWSDFRPSPPPPNEDPYGFVPVVDKKDLRDAYFQVPVRRPSIVALAAGSRWEYFESFCMPFGDRLAVPYFQGNTQFIERVIAHYLGIPTVGYIDDFLSFIPYEVREIVHNAIQAVLTLFGFTISPKADGNVMGSRTEPVEVLGLLYKSSEEALEILISEDRVLQFKEEVEKFSERLNKNEIVERDVQRIHGLVCFICYSREIFSEGPLIALLNPLVSRSPHSWSTSEIDRVLLLLNELTTLAKERMCVKLSRALFRRPTITIFSDAACTRRRFGMAFVIRLPGRNFVWSWRGERSELPEGLQAASILDLELLAAVAAVAEAGALAKAEGYADGAIVDLKVDNVGACHILRKSGGAGPISAAIVSLFVRCVTKEKLWVNTCYISTKRNPADEPSRTGELLAVGLKVGADPTNLSASNFLAELNGISFALSSGLFRVRLPCSGAQHLHQPAPKTDRRAKNLSSQAPEQDLPPGSVRDGRRLRGLQVRKTLGAGVRANAKQSLERIRHLYRK